MGRPGPHPAAIARTTDEARAGRSEIERRYLADPEAGRRQLAAWLEAGDVEMLRLAAAVPYAAFSRRDWEMNTIAMDADDYVFRQESLVSLIRWTGTGRGSGASLVWESVNENHIRDGLAISQTFWWDRDEAERELGITLPR